MVAWPDDDWERTVAPLDLGRDEIDALLGRLGPATSVELLTHGKANTNLRIEREGRPPVVLRIHQRDCDGLAREQALWARLSGHVPVPACLGTGRTRRGHPVAVLEHVEGVPPAHALAEHPEDAEAIGHALGRSLAGLLAFRSGPIGVYAPDLSLARRFDSIAHSYEDLIRWSLRQGRARHRLGPDLTAALLAALPAALAALEPLEDHPGLAHGDFKSSNLLLRPEPWRVVAVLDWEFARPFTPMLDVATLFRHRAHWPAALQEGFEDGYRAHGGWLPEGWRATCHVVDLMNLVGFLNASGERPRLFEAVTARIARTLRTM